MVDYSGNVVDTFNMTKGLFDAYSKMRTEQQAREKAAAEMQQQNEKAATLKQIGAGVQNGDMDPRRLTGMLFQADKASDALTAMKLTPQQWQLLNQPSVPGQLQARPTQPALPSGGQQNRMPQYEMPPVYQAQLATPAVQTSSPAFLNRVRSFLQDRALQSSGMRGR